MVAGAGSVFVGRARELAELEGALDDARAGRGAAILLGGDAGIGKTRLVSELAQRARAAGFVVLLGHSLDLAGTELPYHPFVEALRPWGQPWADAGESGFGSQLRVFERMLSLLEERAASDPVLLVLEDVHWADVSTVDLTVYLAHHVDILPVLLVATARVDEIGSRDLIRTLADGIRHSVTGLVVDLAPLHDDEVSALIEGASAAPLATATAEAIVARSEGNPFFAEELLTAAGSGQYLRLPDNLRDLLLHRTSGLDQALR
jgi:predicted ATPase